jgi:hypothetical protein
MVLQARYSKIAVLAAFAMLTVAGLVLQNGQDTVTRRGRWRPWGIFTTTASATSHVQGRSRERRALMGRESVPVPLRTSLLPSSTPSPLKKAARLSLRGRGQGDDYTARPPGRRSRAKITGADKAADWEGKGKIHGCLITAKSPRARDLHHPS